MVRGMSWAWKTNRKDMSSKEIGLHVENMITTAPSMCNTNCTCARAWYGGRVWGDLYDHSKSTIIICTSTMNKIFTWPPKSLWDEWLRPRFGFANSPPTHTGVGHQRTVSTTTSYNQRLSLVAHASKCGQGISYPCHTNRMFHIRRRSGVVRGRKE